MPAYNEADNIVQNLHETANTLQGLGFDYEVIVVDDGSFDQTWLVAITKLHEYNGRVRIVRYDQNRGKGNALMCGSWYATGDYIVFLDADMDLHPSQLPTFFGIMDAENADVVIGSKMHPGSNVNYPFVRRVWSFGYYTMIWVLFGLPVHDTQTGLKVFKADVLRRVFPRVLVKRFAFDVEVLAVSRRLRYRIVEAPITLTFTRPFGRIRMTDIFRIWLDTLAIFYRLRIKRYYDSCSPLEWLEPDFERKVFDGPLLGVSRSGGTSSPTAQTGVPKN